jgi:hypothetical protein
MSAMCSSSRAGSHSLTAPARCSRAVTIRPLPTTCGTRTRTCRPCHNDDRAGGRTEHARRQRHRDSLPEIRAVRGASQSGRCRMVTGELPRLGAPKCDGARAYRRRSASRLRPCDHPKHARARLLQLLRGHIGWCNRQLHIPIPRTGIYFFGTGGPSASPPFLIGIACPGLSQLDLKQVEKRRKRAPNLHSVRNRILAFGRFNT